MVATKNKGLWLKRFVQLPGRLPVLLIGGLLTLMLCSCANRSQSIRLLDLPDVPTGSEVRKLGGAISEVAPPAVFLDLADLMASAQPQVAIASPKPDQVLSETHLSVEFKLRGLSIYKDEKIGLGPHLQVTLDNQPAQAVYSLDDPLELSDLAPGSHTLRVIAVRPWGESFKNEAAYAQTTFHVLAKTGENMPNAQKPLLTYVEPQGTYGAEPILLDFYLNNAPLHSIAQESPDDDVLDWRLRCTVNGQSFLFDQWQPVYLKGFKPGQNWVQMTLEDEQGNPIDNAFNSVVRIVDYDPNLRDGLAKMVRGELPLEKVGQIAVPTYEPPVEAIAPPAPVESEPAAQPDSEEEIQSAADKPDSGANLDQERPTDSSSESRASQKLAPSVIEDSEETASKETESEETASKKTESTETDQFSSEFTDFDDFKPETADDQAAESVETKTLEAEIEQLEEDIKAPVNQLEEIAQESAEKIQKSAEKIEQAVTDLEETTESAIESAIEEALDKSDRSAEDIIQPDALMDDDDANDLKKRPSIFEQLQTNWQKLIAPQPKTPAASPPAPLLIPDVEEIAPDPLSAEPALPSRPEAKDIEEPVTDAVTGEAAKAETAEERSDGDLTEELIENLIEPDTEEPDADEPKAEADPSPGIFGRLQTAWQQLKTTQPNAAHSLEVPAPAVDNLIDPFAEAFPNEQMSPEDAAAVVAPYASSDVTEERSVDKSSDDIDLPSNSPIDLPSEPPSEPLIDLLTEPASELPSLEIPNQLSAPTAPLSTPISPRREKASSE
jgi:hypothetical protein